MVFLQPWVPHWFVILEWVLGLRLKHACLPQGWWWELWSSLLFHPFSDDVTNSVPQSPGRVIGNWGNSNQKRLNGWSSPHYRIVGLSFWLCQELLVKRWSLPWQQAWMPIWLPTSGKRTTVTVQIVVALIGDQEFDDPKTLSAFALGWSCFSSPWFWTWSLSASSSGTGKIWVKAIQVKDRTFFSKRKIWEKRFKLYGVFAVSLALGAVIFLLFTIFSTVTAPFGERNSKSKFNSMVTIWNHTGIFRPGGEGANFLTLP